MANTLIQIKRSLVSNVPGTLNVGEPAYSYSSNTLFIGTANSNGAIEIGGPKYIDQLFAQYNVSNASFAHANAAFNAANNATDTYVRAHANAAFDAANGAIAVNLTQNNSIFFALNTANAAFANANSYITYN